VLVLLAIMNDPRRTTGSHRAAALVGTDQWFAIGDELKDSIAEEPAPVARSWTTTAQLQMAILLALVSGGVVALVVHRAHRPAHVPAMVSAAAPATPVAAAAPVAAPAPAAVAAPVAAPAPLAAAAATPSDTASASAPTAAPVPAAHRSRKHHQRVAGPHATTKRTKATH
jgi:hypothetical protein